MRMKMPELALTFQRAFPTIARIACRPRAITASRAFVTAGTGNTILVIGASGFVGAQLARTLAARRYHVRVLTRVPERVGDLRSAGIEVCPGSLSERPSLEAACEGVGVVYSTAGLAMSRKAKIPAHRAISATRIETLVETAAAMHVRRIVHCSTTEIHGRLTVLPANEDAALAPRDSWGAAQLEGEQTARDAAARTGVELVVARSSQVYGPGDCRLLPLFRGIVRRRFVLVGPGNVPVHFVYVDDLVEGLRLCGESSRAPGRTFILAGGETMRVDEFARLIAREAGVRLWPVRLPAGPAYAVFALYEGVCRALGAAPTLDRRRLAFYTEQRAFDISRARAELGFAPKVGLREGVRRCLEWYRGRSLV
jgi:nucleoside-diphosphate-sugar epimerase